MNNSPETGSARPHKPHASIPIYSQDRHLVTGPFTSAQASTPALPPLTAEQDAALQAVLAQHKGRPGALLPILHGVQDALQHIPPAAVPLIAKALNLSRAEVHGVVTYYHHFRTSKPTATVLQVCRAEACQSMGGDAIWAHAQRLQGCEVEAAYCLGLCASSPAAMWGDRPVARLTTQRLDHLVGAGA